MKLGKWLALAVAAVILAEGTWSILVSLTRSLLLPLLARVLGGDSHSPLYLGPGDINIPDLFASILQLCLAGIVFLVIKAWAGKGDELRISPAKKISQPPVATAPPTVTAAIPANPRPTAFIAAAAQTSTISSAGPVTSSPAPAQDQTSSPAAAAQAAAVPKKAAEKPATPPKSQKPREVYYNLVGEPINPTEDE
ncbi:MAG: hypothetical protein JOZ80_03930 [Acidobacteriaceae bacterium]|nr:hypothetical protein [Acidobacteriaceae bacterium]